MITGYMNSQYVTNVLRGNNIPPSISEETRQAITCLHTTTAIDFWLTGSRFFGIPRPESDFDFFTGDTPVTHSHLKSNGFVAVLSGYYTDDLTETVYRRGDVHVQIVNDVTLKREIQEHIADSGVVKMMRQAVAREATRRLWRAMIAAAKLRVPRPKVTVTGGKYCSCSGEKVETTVNGKNFFHYCRGCKKEYKP